MTDFIAHIQCTGCQAPVTIRVPAPLKASFILQHFLFELGCRCKRCLEAKTQNVGALLATPETGGSRE